MSIKIVVMALGVLCALPATACAASSPTNLDYMRLSSDRLPKGIQLNVVHTFDSAVSADTYDAEFAYNFLAYNFEFPNGRRIFARVYLSEISSAHVLRCEDPRAAQITSIESCLEWDELRDALRALISLGFNDIELLSADGYQSHKQLGFSFSAADLSAWRESPISSEERN